MLSPGQHAMRDTSLLKGKQQNTTKRTVCTVLTFSKSLLKRLKSLLKLRGFTNFFHA